MRFRYTSVSALIKFYVICLAFDDIHRETALAGLFILG